MKSLVTCKIWQNQICQITNLEHVGSILWSYFLLGRMMHITVYKNQLVYKCIYILHICYVSIFKSINMQRSFHPYVSFLCNIIASRCHYSLPKNTTLTWEAETSLRLQPRSSCFTSSRDSSGASRVSGVSETWCNQQKWDVPIGMMFTSTQ